MTKTRQRLMAVLLVDPKRSWYGRDLARHLKLAPSTLQRDLKRLQRGGLVRAWRNGNRVYYQAQSVNGGIKVRRVAEEKCSARPINTPHTVGRQLFSHSCRNTMDVRLSALAPN